MADVVTLDEAGLAGDPTLGRALRELNNEHAVALSWLEAGRLEALVGRVFWAGRVGALGMLIDAARGFWADTAVEGDEALHVGDLGGAGVIAADEIADVISGVGELAGSGLGLDPLFEGVG